MSRKTWTRSVLAASVLLVAAAPLLAAGPDPKKGGVKSAPKTTAPEMTPEQKAQMEAWMKAATPGPQHKELGKLAGHWKMTVTDYTSGQPKTEPGTCDFRPVLGGRFVEQTCRSQFNGMPFNGVGYVGYDNVKQVYTSVWFDSMGTSMMYSEGKADSTGKVITAQTEMTDPATGKPMKMTLVTTIESPDRHTFTMSAPGPDGKDMKMMEIVYERAKGQGKKG